MIRALQSFDSSDLPSDFNDRYRGLVKKGIYSGGSVSAGPPTDGVAQPTIVVGPFVLVSNDGMVCREDSASQTLTVNSAGGTQIVGLRAIYSPVTHPTLEWIVCNVADIATVPDLDSIIWFATFTASNLGVDAASVEVYAPHRMDYIGRTTLRPSVLVEADLPTDNLLDGDVAFVKSRNEWFRYDATAEQWYMIGTTQVLDAFMIDHVLNVGLPPGADHGHHKTIHSEIPANGIVQDIATGATNHRWYTNVNGGTNLILALNCSYNSAANQWTIDAPTESRPALIFIFNGQGSLTIWFKQHTSPGTPASPDTWYHRYGTGTPPEWDRELNAAFPVSGGSSLTLSEATIASPHLDTNSISRPLFLGTGNAQQNAINIGNNPLNASTVRIGSSVAGSSVLLTGGPNVLVNGRLDSSASGDAFYLGTQNAGQIQIGRNTQTLTLLSSTVDLYEGLLLTSKTDSGITLQSNRTATSVGVDFTLRTTARTSGQTTTRVLQVQDEASTVLAYLTADRKFSAYSFEGLNTTQAHLGSNGNGVLVGSLSLQPNNFINVSGSGFVARTEYAGPNNQATFTEGLSTVELGSNLDATSFVGSYIRPVGTLRFYRVAFVFGNTCGLSSPFSGTSGTFDFTQERLQAGIELSSNGVGDEIAIWGVQAQYDYAIKTRKSGVTEISKLVVAESLDIVAPIIQGRSLSLSGDLESERVESKEIWLNGDQYHTPVSGGFLSGDASGNSTGTVKISPLKFWHRGRLWYTTSEVSYNLTTADYGSVSDGQAKWVGVYVNMANVALVSHEGGNITPLVASALSFDSTSFPDPWNGRFIFNPNLVYLGVICIGNYNDSFCTMKYTMSYSAGGAVKVLEKMAPSTTVGSDNTWTTVDTSSDLVAPLPYDWGKDGFWSMRGSLRADLSTFGGNLTSLTLEVSAANSSNYTFIERYLSKKDYTPDVGPISIPLTDHFLTDSAYLAPPGRWSFRYSTNGALPPVNAQVLASFHGFKDKFRTY